MSIESVDDVARRVAHIEAIKSDDEAAHSEQDKLYVEVLTAIAEGADGNADLLAAEALRVEDIEFSRWCA